MTSTRPADDDDEVNEQFRSLMEGLRTSLPGVQVLFAFLLTTPLQSRFAAFDDVDRVAFAVAFYASGLASVLLIAPSVHQRMRAPISGLARHSKRHLIWATWVAVAGSVTMAVALMATVYLVSRLVFDGSVAALATASMTAALVWSWLFLPLVTFRRS